MATFDEELLSALADQSRRSVLEKLLAGGALTQTELAAELPFSRQAVAKHLLVLERIGLVESHKSGREVRYIVQRKSVDRASRAMSRLAAQWEQRLVGIKQIAEATHRRQK